MDPATKYTPSTRTTLIVGTDEREILIDEAAGCPAYVVLSDGRVWLASFYEKIFHQSPPKK